LFIGIILIAASFLARIRADKTATGGYAIRLVIEAFLGFLENRIDRILSPKLVLIQK